MIEAGSRMSRQGSPPTDSEIAAWVGEGAFVYWKHVTRLIEENYPDVFTPQWLFGGRKHGWSLRYRKGKSFCTLIPQRNQCALLIVFGREERKAVESMRDMLSAQTRKEYDDAVTYHDGKWVRLTVDSVTVIEDVGRLLSVKRKPKTDRACTTRP